MMLGRLYWTMYHWYTSSEARRILQRGRCPICRTHVLVNCPICEGVWQTNDADLRHVWAARFLEIRRRQQKNEQK